VANFTKSLADGPVPTSLTPPVYAPPALTKALIRQMVVCNPTAAVIQLTVEIVTKSAGTPPARTIINTRNVAVNETYLCPEILNAVIDVGGSIEMLASSAGLQFVISGVEMT